MWWVYRKIRDTDLELEYEYSRESETYDGIIVYDKTTKESILKKPCENDAESEWSQGKAVEKFVVCVAGEGFPDKRRVVIG